MKNLFKKGILGLSLVFGIVLFGITNTKAETAKKIGSTEATITGSGYEIDEAGSKIILKNNADVELAGTASDYTIKVEKNANVVIKLNKFSAKVNYKSVIDLQPGSNAKLVLNGGGSTLHSDYTDGTVPAIRVPKTASLVIEGTGNLTAVVSSESSTKVSGVIGEYADGFGTITVNSGSVDTYSVNKPGSELPKSGIGLGNWNEGKATGTININGGMVITDVIGVSEGTSDIKLNGNGKGSLVVFERAEVLERKQDFHGLFGGQANSIEAYGNTILCSDLDIVGGDVLTIKEGSSLTIPEGITLTNNGTISNSGSIVNYGTIDNKNILENNGYLNSNSEVANATVAPISYPYLEGETLSYTKETKEGASFRINADYDLFKNGGKVYVDGVLVNSSDYTSKSGSTIINLLSKYLDKLTAGTHTLKVVFNNGAFATTSFTVANNPASSNTVANNTNNTNNTTTESNNNETKNEVTNNPKTGDYVTLYVSMLGLSVIGLIGAGLYLKRRA